MNTLIFVLMLSLHTGQTLILAQAGCCFIPHSSHTHICLQGINKMHLDADKQIQQSILETSAVLAVVSSPAGGTGGMGAELAAGVVEADGGASTGAW